MNIIGRNIKKLRQAHMVTQEQLASSLSISYQAVSKWETGAAIPDTMMLPQIAGYFDVSIDDLFKKELTAYRHKAQYLCSIYEQNPTPEHFAAAETELIKITENPSSTDLYEQVEDLRQLGNLYAQHMDFCMENAIAYYDKAIKNGIPLREHLYACYEQQKISFLAQIGRGQESVERYLTRIREEPVNCENYICAICAALHTEQYGLAQELSEKALSYWQNNVMLYRLCGDVYRKRKLYDKAFSCWNKSLELNRIRWEETGENGFMEALFSMAECWEELGEKENAAKTWKELADWLDSMGFELEKEVYLKKVEQNMQ